MVAGSFGKHSPRAGETFSSETAVEDTAQLGEDTSPHTQHSWSEQGLALRFSDLPLENFTSVAPLPSREHNGAGAGEAAFICRKGRTRFNDVKVKHGRGINPSDKHPEVCLALGAFKSWLGFSLPEGLCFSRDSPRRVGFKGLCYAGGQERGTQRCLLALKI